MSFKQLAEKRQSCRSYDKDKDVLEAEIRSILEAAILAPSACNGQPYKFTLCKGQTANEVAKECMGMGMNKFVIYAPALIVISEDNYNATAAMGAKIKGNDYRSIDIGIAAAYITAEAASIGLGSCILGWFDDMKIREICSLDKPVRLVIAIGHAMDSKIRQKKRKNYNDIVKILE